MAFPRQLSDDQVDWVRRMTELRRRLYAQLREIPTPQQMADKLGVSRVCIRRIEHGETYQED